jgi:hypothetical protein
VRAFTAEHAKNAERPTVYRGARKERGEANGSPRSTQSSLSFQCLSQETIDACGKGEAIREAILKSLFALSVLSVVDTAGLLTAERTEYSERSE